ncbi:MAG: hypothetical protein H6779_04945 [Candidatus Nomurabacteria bacterium]|nr:hypothetical protein [Candidatus Nomurabacteria bacterium]USN87715.1 MAG: hypothetical protein H6779_04945 [Candidatus Nomurabacteria bacterium]
MFKAIGFIIILWALSHFFTEAFTSLNSAAAQSFKTIETAAAIAEVKMIEES